MTNRAPGPFKVEKHQYLTHTDVHIRTYQTHPQGGWRVLTVEDGWYDIKATAAFFGAAEEMYLALCALLPLGQWVTEGINALLDKRGVPASPQRDTIVNGIGAAFKVALDAKAKADTPVEDMPGEPKASEPSYKELVAATREIRRIVGDGTVPPQGVVDIEADWTRLAEILDSLQPKALQPVTEVETAES